MLLKYLGAGWISPLVSLSETPTQTKKTEGKHYKRGRPPAVTFICERGACICIIFSLELEGYGIEMRKSIGATFFK